VVRANHGIDLAELTVAVSRMFGLQRTTEETAAMIRRVAMNLQREGALTIKNEHVRLGRSLGCHVGRFFVSVRCYQHMTPAPRRGFCLYVPDTRAR